MTQGPGNPNKNRNDEKKDELQQPQRVIDFTEIREKKLERKRRRTERIFFKNLINVFSVTGPSDAHPIELIELSEEGCSFQVSSAPGKKPWPAQSNQVPIRLYFSQDTYLEIFVNIQNSRPSIENGMKFIRYGCKIDQGVQSYPAYLAFVRFMKLYAEQAHRDLGDVSAFYL